jgi:RNA polymerase sigma-70 factor (ECF subfamily)
LPPPSEAYAESPEPLIVRLAGRGDRHAFEELVRRRQSWVRNLMRRMSRDAVLADDLAQQVFIQVWRRIGQLQHPERFPGWLKRIAVNVWLQHDRRNDPLDSAGDAIDDLDERAENNTVDIAVDIDQALAMLPNAARLCIVLSYHAQMSHAEIAEITSMPLGTIKSHIRRGTERLQTLLSAYADCAIRELAS